ncbi:hypothetical protein D3C79_1058420 [compost metagenome]
MVEAEQDRIMEISHVVFPAALHTSTSSSLWVKGVFGQWLGVNKTMMLSMAKSRSSVALPSVASRWRS